MGMAGIVGAYLAGLLISMTPFQNEIFEGVEKVGYAFFILFLCKYRCCSRCPGPYGKPGGITLLTLLLAILTKIIGCGAGQSFPVLLTRNP